MSQNLVRREKFHRGWVVVGLAGALLWCAAAFIWPSPLVSIPDGLRLPFGLLGVLFLVCSVWAWSRRPGRWTTVFLLYGLGGGVHWGGAIDPRHAGLELSLFFVYLGFTALADAALLHLALIFPSGKRLALSMRVALYSVAVTALVLAPLAGLMPRTALEPVVGLILLASSLFSLGAGVVFIVSLVRVDPATRWAARLPLIVSGLILAFFLATLGTSGFLLRQSEAWNLMYGLVPMCLAFALVSLPRAGLVGDSQQANSAGAFF